MKLGEFMTKLFTALVIFSVSLSSLADCKNMFDQRGSNQNQVDSAISCYENLLTTSNDSEKKANSLLKMSYLHIFKSEFYLSTQNIVKKPLRYELAELFKFMREIF